MNNPYTDSTPIKDFDLFKKKNQLRIPFSICLEITARCNNNCRHCYINLPVNAQTARPKEISFDKIKKIIDEAVEMGTLWCGLTGGEPLLRNDFEDIYIYLKKKGLLVSVLTNATLITENHIKLFRKYPPRHLEVSVYGVSKETYERVSHVPDSFEKFCKGLHRILDCNINTIFKVTVMQSNKSEIDKVIKFCSGFKNTAIKINTEIHASIYKDKSYCISERVAPKEINQKWITQATHESCYVDKNFSYKNQFGGNLFLCNAGLNSFWVDSAGCAHICSIMRHPNFKYDLIKNNIKKYWHEIIPAILSKKSDETVFKNNCAYCEHRKSCAWCPAKSYIENGKLFQPIDYYCQASKI